MEGPQESKNQTNELFRAENRVDVAENSKESYDGAATNSGILDARFVTSTSVAPCLDGNGHETRFGPTGRESLELDSTENEIDHNQKTTAAKEIEQSDIHVPIKDLQRTEEKKCVESSELCSSDRALGNDKSGNVPKDATAERSNAEASPVYPNLDSLTRETGTIRLAINAPVNGTPRQHNLNPGNIKTYIDQICCVTKRKILHMVIVESCSLSPT